MNIHEFLDDEFQKAFEESTVFRRTKDGYSVKCRKGLWAVEGPDREIVGKEAWHYFVRYYVDGEYD